MWQPADRMAPKDQQHAGLDVQHHSQCRQSLSRYQPGYKSTLATRSTRYVMLYVQALPACSMLHFAAADLEEACDDHAAAALVYASFADQLLPEPDESGEIPSVQVLPVCASENQQFSGQH